MREKYRSNENSEIIENNPFKKRKNSCSVFFANVSYFQYTELAYLLSDLSQNVSEF